MSATMSSAAREADRLRAEIWGDLLPIDPVLIAQRLGIVVLNAGLDPDVQGALIKEPGRDPKIILNETDSLNRRRFTCAHEIGHFVRREGQLEQYEYIDFRDTASTTGHDPEERYANQFAAVLLMPEQAVRELRGRGLSEVQLALRFGVSREAMHYRLQALNLHP